MSNSAQIAVFLLISLVLPGAARAQSAMGLPDTSSLFRTSPHSIALEPILNFPTDEPPSQLRPISYDHLPVQDSHVHHLSLLPGAEPDWTGPIYETPDYGRSATPIPHVEVPYEWSLLPTGMIYKSYLAGVKESRLSTHLIKVENDNWMMDGNLGGRFGVLRWGRDSTFLAEGVQWDVEGSAHVRLDIPEDVDVRSVDFRAGTQLTWSYADNPAHRSRFGYYHLSSHLGDEFVIKNPDYNRLNFARDVVIFGHSYYFTTRLRVYAEAGWAFYHLECDPWEFHLGVEWAPNEATGPWGEPFLAVHGHLREESNFGGNLSVQTGWAWVGEIPGRTLRIGMHYYNGESSQFSFAGDFEHQIGFGIWYDF